MKKALILLLIFSLTSCKSKNHNNDRNTSYSSSYDEDEYSDGTYCAEIKYYYSKTGTRSTYTLEIEIENNELTAIHWPNGGWLDDSHFYPPDISNGYAEFESDQGVEYSVEIIGEEGDCNLSNYAPSENSFVEEEDEKYEEENDWYDDENEDEDDW